MTIPVALRLSPAWRASSKLGVTARWWTGGLLLAAGLAKTYDHLHWVFPPVLGWHPPPLFLIGWAGGELALATSLLLTVQPRLMRGLALGLFTGFLVLVMMELILGTTTCGCLGRWSPSPWIMLPVDVMTVILLLAWRPPTSRWTQSVWLRWSLVTALPLMATWLALAAPNPTPELDQGRGYRGPPSHDGRNAQVMEQPAAR